MEENKTQNIYEIFQKKQEEEESKKDDELIGKEFGDLTVQRVVYEDKTLNYKNYLCLCKCGETTTADKYMLLSGEKTNCGCKYYDKIFILECKNCGSKIKIPFKQKDLKKKTIPTYTDVSGNQHYDVLYELSYSCKECSKLTKRYNTKTELLEKFIKQKCQTSLDIFGNIRKNIELKDRTLRSEFKKKYIEWIKQNDLEKYLLTTKELNQFLAENYNEYYIKSGGNIYLTRIRLAD